MTYWENHRDTDIHARTNDSLACPLSTEQAGLFSDSNGAVDTKQEKNGAKSGLVDLKHH
jgi:hypothetical protein